MFDTKVMLQYTKELSVLYIEDDSPLLQSTTKLFKNYFSHLDTAMNGEEGLKKYIHFKKLNSHFYDLVITDIKMPKLDGLEMSKEMIKLNSMQSIIITTAHNENEILLNAIELGITAFLSKPLESQRLKQTLYKIAQAIYDRKFVEDHVEMIENLNLRLEEQNQELLTKNTELEKSFRMLDTVVNKQQMIHKKKEPIDKQETNANEKEFLEQIAYLVNDDLYELQEILDEIDKEVINLIEISENATQDDLTNLIENFKKYTSILQMYSFFVKLSHAMMNFAHTMQNNPLPQNKETTKNIFMLLESFIYVLGNWHKDISSEKSEKINQFDNSIISDMNTITNMWTQVDEEFNEDDLDDIFDF